MTNKCFGIMVIRENGEKIIYDLSNFNIFIRQKVKELMYATGKEVNERLGENCTIDISLEIQQGMALVGTKINYDTCFIFTTEMENHKSLVTLSRCILVHGLLDTIEQNFSYIKSELKCQEIHHNLMEVKTIMINNIDLVLKRGEKLDDLVMKTQHLSDSSKKFYMKAKKLNKCCFIL